MHILTVLFFVFSAEARFSRCAYLLPDSGRTVQTPDATRLATAEAWLDAYEGEPTGLERYLEDHDLTRSTLAPSLLKRAAASYALERWQRWNEVNQEQRDAAAGLELRMLLGPSGSTVIPFDGNYLVTSQSRANRDRLLERARALFPLLNEAPPATAARARAMAADIRLHYLRPHDLRATGAYPPLASPAELRRFGLRERAESYYSRLIGGSPSVGFDLWATRFSERAFNLGSHLALDTLRLDDDFASSAGFVLPHLNGPLDLLRVMAKWSPRSLDQLAHAMRYSLPHSVRTGPELLAYAESVNPETLFGDPARLAPLRERLADLFMVTDDAEDFLRQTFERYLLWSAERDAAGFRALVREFGQVGGAQRLFRREFLGELGWSGISLRVPTSVPVSQFTILRAEGLGTNPGFRHVPHPGRLDRSYAP